MMKMAKTGGTAGHEKGDCVKMPNNLLKRNIQE
jgi:hypothetical protein